MEAEGTRGSSSGDCQAIGPPTCGRAAAALVAIRLGRTGTRRTTMRKATACEELHPWQEDDMGETAGAQPRPRHPLRRLL